MLTITLLKFRKCCNSLQGRPLWPSATYIVNYYIHQVFTPLIADGHKGRPCKGLIHFRNLSYFIAKSAACRAGLVPALKKCSTYF